MNEVNEVESMEALGKRLGKLGEPVKDNQHLWPQLAGLFTERDAGLINNCQQYAHANPSGLPGHNLMMIISKLCDLYDLRGIDILEAREALEV